MSDIELDNDSDHEVSATHSKLIEAVSQLDKGQRVKKPERSEPTLEVSEFHLVKSGITDKDAVHVQDLAKVLGKKGHHTDITKKLQSTKQKTKLLSKPLEKPAADRIKRVVGFQAAKKELKKWNAVITKNRVSESLRFPLSQSHVEVEPTTKFVERFRVKSDLEKELASLEPQKENIEEKKDEFSMTFKEIMMKRKEVARLRAQQSFREAKAHRQKKIKSKKFHRVEKKRRIKTQLKEFEQLQKTDPEAALQKLEQLDKARAEERMSLRHKSTGHWAKNKQIRAKYDKETRQVLAEQLSIGREITQKVKRNDDSEDEVEETDTSIRLSANDKENPWVGRGKTESEIDTFIKGYRKYWDDRNKELQNKKDAVTNDKTEKEQVKDVTENGNNSYDDSEDKNMEHSDTESPKMEVKITKQQQQETEEEKKEQEENIVKKEDTEVKEIKCSKKKLVNEKGKKRKLITDSEPNTVSKGAVAIKKKKAEVKKTKKKPTATSQWNVEVLNEEEDEAEEVEAEEEVENDSTKELNTHTAKPKDILELFDSMEDRIRSKLELKLQETKKKLMEPKKISKESTKKRRGKGTDEFDGLEMKNERKRPALDGPLDETAGDQENTNAASSLAKLVNLRNAADKNTKSTSSEAEIDPNKYINVKPKQLNTELPDIVTRGDDALDDSENDEEQHNIISEAFADDDVVDEFRKQKEEEAEKSKPKSIDLRLPGWGSWGGKGIKVSKRKEKRFIVKLPEKVEPKPENKGDVIIIEEEKPKIKEHLVNDLPYPFTSVKDFEASIRMPIGRNFIPENAHRKLIEPVVKTSIGKVIEPMDEDVLVNKPTMDRNKFIDKKKSRKADKKGGKVSKKQSK